MSTLGNLFKLTFWSKSRVKTTISDEPPITLVLPRELDEFGGTSRQSFAPAPAVLSIDSGIFPEVMPVVLD
ncbi:MAG: hypothetical protein KC777_08215 [Cyanobacteria bacterium HKST-UBA02]|nr:hypothetical protein [Cyanobacteria bacterium HKST-UBA02]